MRLHRSLTARIVVVALTIGVVSTGVGVSSSIRSYRAAIGRMLEDRWRGGDRERLLARCLADPERFRHRGGIGIRYDAWDLATGRSADPRTPSVDRFPSDLSPDGALATPFWPQKHFTAFARGAERGPCSVIGMQVEPPRGVPGNILRDAVLTVGGIGLGSALFVGFLVVAPLRRRVTALRRAAQAVGTPAYPPEPGQPRDELGELGRSIDAAHERIRADTEQLVASRAALETFLADVAHDLQTPLTSLRLALEELADAPLEPADREALRAALDDVVYASSLTTNLRIASRLEHGAEPLERQRVDLREIAERAGKREQIFARRRGMTLTLALPDAGVWVEADPTMAEQALTNVLQNAIIHGDEGGRVEMSLEGGSDGAFRWEVRDDGPGVPPEILPRLGERAFRSDEARARDPKGTGLGLAITREVCRRVGWTLSFAARAPRGLVVRVEGPRPPGVA
jgi:signal transduction histidine kinase